MNQRRFVQAAILHICVEWGNDDTKLIMNLLRGNLTNI